KRIRAARACRRFPALLTALSEGRLHLAAVSLLASHLTSESADTLIEAATHRRKTEIEEWLAERFQLCPEPRTSVRVIPPPRPPQMDDSQPQLSMERDRNDVGCETDLAPGPVLSGGLRTKELALGPVPH